MATITVTRICTHCAKQFKSSRRVDSQRFFCNDTCYRLFRQKTPQHFWEQVRKTEGCWLWVGGSGKSNGHRYGTATVDGIQDRAHRLSWVLTSGPIPEGYEVCHKCDEPLCVKPEHLFLGTHKENMEDMARKNRSRRGEAATCVRLTESQVREIRSKYRPGHGHGHIALAREYGVSYGAI